MLFVTLHGGRPGKHAHRNNVHAHDNDGRRITPNVLDDAEDVILDELRSIYRAGNKLYVANANRMQNSVLCYEGTGISYRFVSRFVSKDSCPGVVHPFDFTFDDNGFCYVTSQDTNVVTRLKVSADGRTGTPAPVAPALPAEGRFLPGTFVASSVGNLSDPPTTPVPAPQGLQYNAEGEKKHSVRGVVWANDALYVVDQPAGRVKVYDHSGRLLGKSNLVESPVHVLVQKGSIYVSGGNQVLTARLSKPAGDFTLAPIPHMQVKNSCGMAFTDSGHFYVASRTENTILKFDPNFKPMKFSCELSDNPEFLMHVESSDH